MAQFSVNAQRFDPVQELQVPREVGRPLRRRHQQGVGAEAHHRGGRAPRRRRPVDGAQVAGPHQVRAITLERGVTHDTEFEQWANKVWNFGSGLGAEVSLKDFRKDLIIEVYNEAGQLVIAYKVFRAGCRSSRRCRTSTPTPTRSRSSTSSSRTKAGSATTTSSSRPSRASPSRRDRRSGAAGTRRLDASAARAVGARRSARADRARRGAAARSRRTTGPTRTLGERNALLLSAARAPVRADASTLAEPLPALRRTRSSARTATRSRRRCRSPDDAGPHARCRRLRVEFRLPDDARTLARRVHRRTDDVRATPARARACVGCTHDGRRRSPHCDDARAGTQSLRRACRSRWTRWIRRRDAALRAAVPRVRDALERAARSSAQLVWQKVQARGRTPAARHRRAGPRVRLDRAGGAARSRRCGAPRTCSMVTA